MVDNTASLFLASDIGAEPVQKVHAVRMVFSCNVFAVRQQRGDFDSWILGIMETSISNLSRVRNNEIKMVLHLGLVLGLIYCESWSI